MDLLLKKYSSLKSLETIFRQSDHANKETEKEKGRNKPVINTTRPAAKRETNSIRVGNKTTVKGKS